MKLFKLSAPGWVKEFETEEQLKAELWSHICSLCRNDEEDIIPVTEDSSVGDMLCTSCGCEFDVEYDDE